MASSPLTFLSEVLGRTGSLPYPEHFKFVIRQQLIDLLTDFTSLSVKVDSYAVSNDRRLELLAVSGTLPMYYQGVRYNVPLQMWLSESFPLAAPAVFVVPTPLMIIRPGHPAVSPSGRVSSAYLSAWSYPRSSLRDGLEDLAICFGENPPLYSKPAGWGGDGGAGVAGRPSPPRPQARPPSQSPQQATSNP
ncbi:hypothetical protein H632_c2797p0, partial [Helicosporidium sp. ATCC 50920]